MTRRILRALADTVLVMATIFFIMWLAVSPRVLLVLILGLGVLVVLVAPTLYICLRMIGSGPYLEDEDDPTTDTTPTWLHYYRTDER